LGLAKAGAKDIKDVYLFDLLEKVQKCICKMMTVIGNGMKPVKDCEVGEEDIEYLEKNIKRIEGAAGEIKGFILAGESEVSARLHVARSVCRRAERGACRISDEPNFPPAILKYLNRLSDLLFLLAHEYE